MLSGNESRVKNISNVASFVKRADRNLDDYGTSFAAAVIVLFGDQLNLMFATQHGVPMESNVIRTEKGFTLQWVCEETQDPLLFRWQLVVKRRIEMTVLTARFQYEDLMTASHTAYYVIDTDKGPRGFTFKNGVPQDTSRAVSTIPEISTE